MNKKKLKILLIFSVFIFLLLLSVKILLLDRIYDHSVLPINKYRQSKRFDVFYINKNILAFDKRISKKIKKDTIRSYRDIVNNFYENNNFITIDIASMDLIIFFYKHDLSGYLSEYYNDPLLSEWNKKLREKKYFNKLFELNRFDFNRYGSSVGGFYKPFSNTIFIKQGDFINGIICEFNHHLILTNLIRNNDIRDLKIKHDFGLYKNSEFNQRIYEIQNFLFYIDDAITNIYSHYKPSYGAILNKQDLIDMQDLFYISEKNNFPKLEIFQTLKSSASLSIDLYGSVNFIFTFEKLLVYLIYKKYGIDKIFEIIRYFYTADIQSYEQIFRDLFHKNFDEFINELEETRLKIVEEEMYQH